jgi:RNA polymerase sigma factor (sigma-70 family)
MEAAEIEQLLDRLGTGDQAATEQVFRAYEPFLRKVVRRRLPAQARSRLGSSDIVQSVWADLLEGFREARWRFADAGHLRAFLVRAVQYRLFDRARQALTQARREEPLPRLPADLPGAEPRPSERAQAEAVWEKLLALSPPRHHDILRLRRSGLTLREVAERTGLHEGSVRRFLRQLARQAAFRGADALADES